jgi:tRNA/tmRNA/rRNA uracil-C5-methylase (TrmA/RlmC/RlmD family)
MQPPGAARSSRGAPSAPPAAAAAAAASNACARRLSGLAARLRRLDGQGLAGWMAAAAGGLAPYPTTHRRRTRRGQSVAAAAAETPIGQQPPPPPAVGDTLTLTCTRLGSNARGICPTESGFVVMVPRALPGEVLTARVTAVKPRYAEAARVATLRPHDSSVPPPCPHFAACGGCPLQSLDYAAQLAEKRNQVVQLLARVGGVADAERLVGPTVGAPTEGRFGYRNKLQFAFGGRVWRGEGGAAESASGGSSSSGHGSGGSSSGGSGNGPAAPPFALGYLAPGTSNVVLPITSCLLQGPAANRALAAVREEAAALGLEPADAPSRRGVLRHCVIRSAAGGSSGDSEEPVVQLQVVIVTAPSCDPELIRPLAKAVAARVPELVSFVHSVEAAGPQLSQSDGRRGGRQPQGRRGSSSGGGGRQRGQQQRFSSRTDKEEEDGNGADQGGGGRGGARALRVDSSVPLLGPPALTQGLCGLDFEIGPHSFFQTNTAMAEVLYDLVAQGVAGGPPPEAGGQLEEAGGQLPPRLSSVLDLYTGTGTIALSLARKLNGSSSGSSSSSSSSSGLAVAVWGADVNESAIEDARRNAAANGVADATFVCGDLDDLVKRSDLLPAAFRGSSSSSGSSGGSSSSSSGLGAIVVDPARAGLGQPVVDFLCRSGTPRVVYVSCNPATQARDLKRLAGSYRVVAVTPVDLFPQTEHVETVAVLERIIR